MILFYLYRLSIAIVSILFKLLLDSHSCVAENPEETQAVTFNPEKPISENFFNYSQFALYYFPQVHFFDKYFTIVLFTIGFPGNFIAFMVWSSKRMYHGNSAAVYLAALSLNDTIVLAISLFRDLTRTWDVPFYPTPGSCEVLETLTLTVQYASPMFVLAFTVERWLAICQPFMVSRICSVKRAVHICVGIILLTLLVCSPMAYLMGTDPQGCQARSTAVFYFTTTLEVLYSLVAPLLVLTFNCLVINEMAKIRRAEMKKMIPGVPRGSSTGGRVNDSGMVRRLLRKSTSDKDSEIGTIKLPPRGRAESDQTAGGGEASSPKFKSTTIMLLVVSFYVIFATLLGGLWYVLDLKFSIDTYVGWPKRQFDESKTVARALKLRMIKIICDELALSHFAMGFVLYFSTGKNFRDEVHRLFIRCGICSRGKASDNTRNSLSSEMGRSSVSTRTNRENKRLLTSMSNHRQEGRLLALRRGLLFFKRGRKSSDFPGLDQCGRRGERQPSKLLLTSKANANGDFPSPL
ncbi:rhodopsin orphan GPCR [Echinococcus multilocularis]|uniref:Rhodopsin orphan GPCR n=1 Tax=Echinococcus multilocularis TaxID=6211 RepID=A0A068YHL5_ECHMU|nr:rhodopsin orphan GPCR [Echinococcus multilocularis]